MKTALFNLLLLIIGYQSFGQDNKRVHLTGSFPDLPGARFSIIPLKIDTPLNKGKLDIWVENIEAGTYPIGINYPLNPGSAPILIRGNDGKVKPLNNKNPNTALFTYIYLNPNQSKEYVLKPMQGLTTQNILNYKHYDSYKSDLFGLNIVSTSEDTKLYQKIAKLDQEYKKLLFYELLDSLYQESIISDKIYSDFEKQARELNRQYNYAALLKAKRDFAVKYPNSPIAALGILDVDSLNLAGNLNAYQEILDKMTGRALKSSYYKNMKLKIDALKGVNVKEGDFFALPSGKTPESNTLNYNQANYKYTLVEFWASWCLPCRAQNPKWNVILNEYKNRGFAILGISLDQYSQEWVGAIKKDKLENWMHVSDLEYPWNSANALRYGIQAIPFNLLIDAEGKVLKKNIDPSEVKEFLIKNFKTNNN